MQFQESYSFDDVLLTPKYSNLKSRSEVNLSININHLTFNHPIVPANMKTVVDVGMMKHIILHGGLALLHRFMPLATQLEWFSQLLEIPNSINYMGASLGVKEEDKVAAQQLFDLGLRIFCIDIAHGDSSSCIEMITWLKTNLPGITLIAGNVATGSGARKLWLAGADIVKVGIGGGATCSTRIQTGNGVCQLSAIMAVAKEREQLEYNARVYRHNRSKYYFISDGGIKTAGDIVKALCFADMVMVGNLFARCLDSPGERQIIDGQPYKEYRGSSTYKETHIEGVRGWVPCEGTYHSILTQLMDGVRSGCSYQGVNNLIDLRHNPMFIKVSHAGLIESKPHDIIL